MVNKAVMHYNKCRHHNHLGKIGPINSEEVFLELIPDRSSLSLTMN